MTKEMLINLENHAEENVDKNEYSKAILGSIRDTFDDVVRYSKVKGSENLALYELERVADRTENLFNLLNVFLLDSTELNEQVIKQINKLKREAKQGD